MLCMGMCASAGPGVKAHGAGGCVGVGEDKYTNEEVE